jgi:putative ABC transport system substrate-binding protein
VNRRAFLVLIVLASAPANVLIAAPPASAAETIDRTLRLGFVGPGSRSTAPRGLQAFWKRLRELGYVEGRNLVVESVWAEGKPERLPGLMADVLGRQVDVLVTYSTAAAIAAKGATSAVPVVVAIMGDPLQTGLAVSLARPGGNLTGLSAGFGETAGKWLELLYELIPRLSVVALLHNPDNPLHLGNAKALHAIAPARHLKVVAIEVREAGDIEGAFEQARKSAQGAVVLTEPFVLANKQRVAALATRHRLPVLYNLRDYVEAGGLMAYGPDFAVMFARAADYVDRIVRGARPADLPIEQPTKFELVVNLKAARALGLELPAAILARADEVIQ